MRVAVCEDDAGIRQLVVRALSFAGHDSLTAHRGREALGLFGPEAAISVVVMDIGLPDSDGRDVVQALRSSGQHAPVIFLTALDEVQDRLAGFRAGGDDYLTKPFDVRELIARVEALGRRGGTPASPAPDGLHLDPVTHSIRTSAAEVRLTPTEFRVLAAIASRPGEVVRRHTVTASGWPHGGTVSDNTLDSFVRRVRGKLEDAQAPVSIETVRGVGFRIR